MTDAGVPVAVSDTAATAGIVKLSGALAVIAPLVALVAVTLKVPVIPAAGALPWERRKR